MQSTDQGLLPTEKRIGAKPAPRQSNFELLRILLMLMIIAHHITVHGEFQLETLPLLNRPLRLLLSGWGKAGVDGFILLAGYFMCTSKAAKPDGKKIAKIALQAIFYSYTIIAVLGFTGIANLSESNWKVWQFFLPLTQGVNWFVTAYIILLLVAPFLNILIRNMGQKAHLRLVLILFFVFSLLPSLMRVSYGSDFLTGFTWLYLLAAYIRLYPPPLLEKRWVAVSLIVSACLIYVFYRKAIELLAFVVPHILKIAITDHGAALSVPSIMLGLGLFLFFKNLSVKPNRAINLIASTTFGIYLFHDNPLMWQVLWLRLFHSADYGMQVPGFWLHMLWAPIAVFLACMVVDLIRQYALERPLFKLIDKITARRKEKRVAN